MNKFFITVAFFLQILFSIFSFIFYHIIKYLFQRVSIIRKKQRIKSGDAFQWTPFSDLIKKIMPIPVYMVNGPRWNCHAAICTVGPFKVNSHINIQVGTTQQCTDQWSIVIYKNEEKNRTFLSSKNTPEKEEWRKINLASGIYHIVLRYYKCHGSIECPAIKIDGEDKVPSRLIENEMLKYEAFLKTVQDHRGWFYYCLHCYVYMMLKWRKYLPVSFVQKEYLPAGNPDTLFFYGHINEGDVLQVDIEDGTLEIADIYISYYNICSFPVMWESIRCESYKSTRSSCKGHYLIRVQSKKENLTSANIRHKLLGS